jgi:signal recognition particle subunit SRP54
MPLGQVGDPGMGGWRRRPGPQSTGGDLRVEAIIRSMTTRERRDPTVLNASRRRRIASGSGTTLTDVNRLVKQFAEMQKLMKQVASSGRRAPVGLIGRR